jgi:hypothetical protein
MENVALFYGHLEYITAIWYLYGLWVVLWLFGIFYTFLVYCIKTHPATLLYRVQFNGKQTKN